MQTETYLCPDFQHKQVTEAFKDHLTKQALLVHGMEFLLCWHWLRPIHRGSVGSLPESRSCIDMAYHCPQTVVKI